MKDIGSEIIHDETDKKEVAMCGGRKADDVIVVSHLTRSFRVAKREKTGLLSSIHALFHREFVRVDAVDDISFSVEKGEIRGLIGPNGAGKSTTIKIMSGILYPTSGEVNVMGYKPWVDREKYVKNIGVLFGQKTQLEWDLPPMDSFNLRKNLYDIPETQYKENMDYFVDLLSLSDIIHKPVRQLSLGERMKCEFVCAVLHNPPLVFLDEPTIGLDIISKQSIRNFIRKINHEKGTTFILTTHDLSDIENLCKNITVINKGKVVFNDSLEKMRAYLPAQKIVSVQFDEPVDVEKIQAFGPIEFDEMRARFEIDTSVTSIPELVNLLFTSFPVADINIEDVSVEEIIRKIYTD